MIVSFTRKEKKGGKKKPEIDQPKVAFKKLQKQVGTAKTVVIELWDKIKERWNRDI
jgi:hypothetical protein